MGDTTMAMFVDLHAKVDEQTQGASVKAVGMSDRGTLLGLVISDTKVRRNDYDAILRRDS